MTGNSGVPADSGYVEPGGRAPAPAPLRVAQIFANTADLEEGTDALDTPERLTAWLAHHAGLPAGQAADDGDLVVAIDLREGLRALASSHNGAHEHDGAQIRRLQRALDQLLVELQVSGATLKITARRSSPVRRALTQIAVAVARAEPGQLARLKACRRPVCRWVFYDASRNHGSTWCAMDICGARTKMGAYRSRHPHGARRTGPRCP